MHMAACDVTSVLRCTDPFQSAELPEKIEDTLDIDKKHWACCAAFNYSATLLAGILPNAHPHASCSADY